MNNLPSACYSQAGKGVFHLLAENTNAAIFLLAGQKIYYANPAAQALTGYSAQALPDMPFEHLTISQDREAFSRLVAGVQHASRDLEPVVLRWQLPGGPLRCLLVSARPVSTAGQPGCLLTAFDLAWVVENTPDLKHQAQDIALEADRRAEELEVVFNAMVEAVLVYDTQK